MIKKKKLLNTKCVFWYSLQFPSETFRILRRTERDIIKNVHWSPCKVAVIPVGFEWNLSFLGRFFKSTQMSNVMKIRPVGAELFQMDGRTDMTKLTVAFRIFAKAPPQKMKTACSLLNRNFTHLPCWTRNIPPFCTTTGNSKCNFSNCCKLCNLVEGQKTTSPLPAPLEVSRSHALRNPD